MKRTAFIAGTAGLATAAALAPARAQSQTIRVGITDNDSGICPFYAQQQGMFTKAGLSVEIQQIGSSGASAQALVAGAVDITVCDAVQVANAVIHGFPMVAIAGGCAFSKDAPTLVLVTQKSGAMHTGKDLEGQTVGVVALKSLSASSVFEWLRVGGADASKVKFIELP